MYTHLEKKPLPNKIFLSIGNICRYQLLPQSSYTLYSALFLNNFSSYCFEQEVPN